MTAEHRGELSESTMVTSFFPVNKYNSKIIDFSDKSYTLKIFRKQYKIKNEVQFINTHLRIQREYFSIPPSKNVRSRFLLSD